MSVKGTNPKPKVFCWHVPGPPKQIAGTSRAPWESQTELWKPLEEPSGSLLAAFWGFLEAFETFWEPSGSLLGTFWGLAGSFYTLFRNLFGTFWEPSGQLLGTLCEPSRGFLATFSPGLLGLGLPRNFFGNILGASANLLVPLGSLGHGRFRPNPDQVPFRSQS